MKKFLKNLKIVGSFTYEAFLKSKWRVKIFLFTWILVTVVAGIKVSGNGSWLLAMVMSFVVLQLIVSMVDDHLIKELTWINNRSKQQFQEVEKQILFMDYNFKKLVKANRLLSNALQSGYSKYGDEEFRYTIKQAEKITSV